MSGAAGAGPVDADRYAEGVLAGDRAILARAITLVESTRPDHRRLAGKLIDHLLPYSGSARRVGISGVPGAGKSTLIDEMGSRLIASGHRIAVLAVDPSSNRTGGSILGDKTRMTRLANDPSAYVRPSPTAGTLGGVAAKTRESIIVVEAAGFDVVIVETVGVGQSEVAVANMVDCFVVLAVARTGDSLQGIKRGILELAEVVAVNKADDGHEVAARATAHELAQALHLFPPVTPGWATPVLTCSGLTGAGVDDLWSAIEAHGRHLKSTGLAEERRADQRIDWMWSTVSDLVLDRIHRDPEIEKLLPTLEGEVRAADVSPATAAQQILRILSGDKGNSDSAN